MDVFPVWPVMNDVLKIRMSAMSCEWGVWVWAPSFYQQVHFVWWQINPLAETSDGQMVAADAKLNFDDNAAFRQKEIFAMRDTTQEDPREVRLYGPQ